MLAREHCVRFTAEPRVTVAEGKTVIVATCVESPGDTRRLLLKYDIGEPPEFLRNVPLPAGFVCPEDRIGSTVHSKNPLVNLASAAFSRVGRAINWAMGTKTAYAIDLGVGGGIDGGGGFSVIGFGLPAYMSAVAGNGQTGTVGSVLAVAPSVHITAAHVGGDVSSTVRGANVTCTVTGGGALLVVGEGLAVSAPAAEDEGGNYTCPQVRLGPLPGDATIKVTAQHLDDNVVVNFIGEGGPQKETLPGSFTFVEHGVAAALTSLINCPLTSPNTTGDLLGRGYYVQNYPGVSLRQVDMTFSADVAGPYTISLTARSGSYTGAVIGTSQTTVTLAQNRALQIPASFAFTGGPSVAAGSTVTFTLGIVSLPPGATSDGLFYGTLTSNADCPIIQTNGTTSLDDFRRNGIAAQIFGDRLIP
jgi:hypothetical protein